MAASKLSTTPPPTTWVHYLAGLALVACSALGLREMRLREPSPGFQDAFQKACENSAVEGDPIIGTYTGIEGVDEFLKLLVAAFWPGIASLDAGFGIQQPYFLVAFLSMLAIFCIEAGRKGNQWSLIAFPSLYVPAYQTIGGAVIIPLYYLGYVVTAARRRRHYFSPDSRTVSVGYARALLPALILGYLVPTVAQCLPVWTPATQQKWIAFWQPCPLYPSLLLLLLSPLLSSSSQRLPNNVPADLKHLNRTYLICMATSVAAHVGAVTYCLTSGDPAVSLAAAFDPRLTTSSSPLVGGLRYIFLMDFWIIVVASEVLMYLTVYDMRRLRKTNVGMFPAIVYLAVASIVLGPAAAFMGVWYWREQLLAKTKAA